jgi:hypothetical protein
MWGGFLTPKLVIKAHPDERNTMYALITEMASTRSGEMRREASTRRRARFARRSAVADHAERDFSGEVTVRRLSHSQADRDALVQLAGRDSSDPLEGEAIGAELDGSLVAAISLENRRVIADPFARTADIRSLLELRVAQLESARSSRPLGASVAIRHAG